MTVSHLARYLMLLKQFFRKATVIQFLIAGLLGLAWISRHKLQEGHPYSGTVAHCNVPCGTVALDSSPLPSSPPTPKSYPYTILTASSANHLCALENYLYALNQLRTELDSAEFPRIVVYNIGMNRTQLPVLNQLRDNGLVDDLVFFDYLKYPRFWDVAVNRGEYAWKTGIVREAQLRYGGVLIWMDAGNVVTSDFLRHIPSIVRQKGFWSPRSSYRMGRWTHRGMYDYFGANPKDYAEKINCNGAAIGFDADNQTVVDTMILPWYECGLKKDCIAPPGSSRRNHRQDQAVLTYLAYHNGYSCHTAPRQFHKLQTHRDSSCAANLMALDLEKKLYHPSSIGKIEIDLPKWEGSDTSKLHEHPEWRYPEDQIPEQLTQRTEPI
ncbi:hypothetical protein EC973_007709 [Apophysomyces ossiformis]|uniref:Uncharacterized protein n=1 Tax=Apophysomyces ossiformis TaxID=679940 RepID=A0A8H7ESW8_9FUNG|nr:hypothetical protein EC973_007709 [Apophysomyces ossiformis]